MSSAFPYRSKEAVERLRHEIKRMVGVLRSQALIEEAKGKHEKAAHLYSIADDGLRARRGQKTSFDWAGERELPTSNPKKTKKETI